MIYRGKLHKERCIILGSEKEGKNVIYTCEHISSNTIPRPKFRISKDRFEMEWEEDSGTEWGNYGAI